MNTMLLEIIALFLLIGVNGVFAMSEMAVVAARKQRLRQRELEGDRGASAAVQLSESPNLFLSTVQVGVTLVGIASGALGGATLTDDVARLISRVEALAPYSETLALVVVLGAITYLSVVLGELVPKRIALARPERVAVIVARPMRLFSRALAPVVHLLSASTRLLGDALGVDAQAEPPVTDDEIRSLFAEGTEAGVFEEAEEDMVRGVLGLGDRRAASLMTPRPEVVCLDVADSREEILEKITQSGYSRFPVVRDSLDDVVGQVEAKDLLLRLLDGGAVDLAAMARAPLYVPEVMPALRVLEALKAAGAEMALVLNEYGSVEGLLTLTDIMEAVVGEVTPADEVAEPEAVQREDGSWLVDGLLPISEFKELLGLESLPEEESGLYQTVAGLLILALGHLPTPGEVYEWAHLRLEVVDMAGQRVRQVLVSLAPPEPQEEMATSLAH